MVRSLTVATHVRRPFGGRGAMSRVRSPCEMPPYARTGRAVAKALAWARLAPARKGGSRYEALPSRGTHIVARRASSFSSSSRTIACAKAPSSVRARRERIALP